MKTTTTAVQPPTTVTVAPALDFTQVKGLEHLKRALEVAVSGGHSILVSGAPGSGKSLCARTAYTILPEPGPWRAPRYSASTPETLAEKMDESQNGILLLENLPVWSSACLDILDRQPDPSRPDQSPDRMILIATSRPCPCGYRANYARECVCSEEQKNAYVLPASIAEAFAITTETGKVEYEKLADSRRGETSASIRERVQAAREMQRERYTGTSYQLNNDLGPSGVQEFCKLDAPGQSLLRAATRQLYLSPRAYETALKVARTIADMARETSIRPQHIAEAIQYRPKYSA